LISQQWITPNTPMGATLTGGGATFRVWAPRATAVYLCGQFNGLAQWNPAPHNLMRVDAHGYWTGFVAGAKDGDPSNSLSLVLPTAATSATPTHAR
jgi:1,4-alpha-glucan branching enzyme